MLCSIFQRWIYYVHTNATFENLFFSTSNYFNNQWLFLVKRGTLKTMYLLIFQECLRKPVSISHNFIALISNLRVQGQGVNLFTMQSARYRLLTTKFTLKVKNVRAPIDVEKATAKNFRYALAALV